MNPVHGAGGARGGARNGTRQRRGVLSALLVALALLHGAAAAAPQDRGPVPPQRPAVGLVLSGGGAGGLAHIGVIRWLEEHRVPIDLIAGTSMGGLLGGLYATGADADEMTALIQSIDWQRLLSTDTPYASRSFRRKEDARETPANFELGLRDGFKLPSGLNAGHQVGLILDRIAFPYAGIASFDRLPTPFACLAVDLEASAEVVFRDGDLSRAMRATMSYPGWFTPVRSNGRVLVDGGVLNNLPTDVMTRMGADFIVAVDLDRVTARDDAYDDVLEVLNRSVAVMMRDNTARNALLADVLVAPDLSDYGFADFARADEIIGIGYEAMEAAADQVAAHALDESGWQRYLEERAARRRSFALTPAFLEVEGAVPADEEAIVAALDHHLRVPLDPDRLDQDLTEIAGWGRYDVVGYGKRARGGEEGLGIVVSEKTHGPPFIRPILAVRGSEFGEALLTFGGRLTFFDPAGTNSELRVDASYGRTTELSAELFVPLGHEGFFVAGRGGAARTQQLVYEGGEAAAGFEISRYGVGFDVGYLFGPRGQVRLGADVEYQSAEVDVGAPLLESVEGDVAALRARWDFDGTNSPVVPTRGLRWTGQGRWIFTSPDVPLGAGDGGRTAPDDDFFQAEIDVLGAVPLSPRWFALASVAGGTSFEASASPLQQFLLGGPLRLGALGGGELRGSHYFLGRAGILWALSDRSQLSFFGSFYLTAFYEVGDAFEDRPDAFQAVTVGIVGETILGGIFGGGALGEQGRRGFFLALGRLF